MCSGPTGSTGGSVLWPISTSKSTKKSTILQKKKKCFSSRKLERRTTSSSIFNPFFVFWVGRQPKIIGWGTLFQFILFFLNGRLAEKTRAGANFFPKKNDDFWLGPKFWLEFFRKKGTFWLTGKQPGPKPFQILKKSNA